ncbi:HDOD domain-containing protein [Propionivibrio sp.]|uniref:HDOD domain-containing protein n=1 Tax=Propionivibrio sp. TaxID=2212460 RepID=UPI0026199172|nr:HDOD domain-containing protein [Propionivibrio sp.]
MDTNQDASADKVGKALNDQRFQMLEDIAKELTGVVVFPTSFDAALRLRKELQNPDLATARIASVVSLEPLIATRLMHMANSTLYSPDGTPARNLQAAISRLGVNLVRTTALGIAMGQLMRAKEMSSFSDIAQTLWNHSVRTAAAARILARTQTRINPDEALLAGLVHDLGAFYMLYRAVQYPELCARPDTLKHLIMQWHESVGVTLLHALGMSEEIVEATIDHDQLRTTPVVVRKLSDIVYYSNILAGAHFEWFDQNIDPNAGEPGIVRRHFRDLLGEIESDTREMQAVFA